MMVLLRLRHVLVFKVLVLGCANVSAITTLAPAVPSVTLNNGVSMPIIALGTGGFDNATATQAVEIAFAGGLRHVHAAYDYFNLPGVGAGLAKHPRDSYFLTAMTSPCIHPAAPPIRNVTNPAACEQLTEKEVDEVLGLLGVEYVDLLLVHGPSAAFGSTTGCSAAVCELNAAQWRAYSRALATGKARAIGVSNYCQSCFECLFGTEEKKAVVPAVNQIQVHVGTGADPEGLVSYCASKGIVVQAYSPLAAGGVIHSPVCTDIGQAVNKSSAQVALRWLVQNPHAKPHMTFVAKADNAQYIAEDLDVFDFNLTEAQVARLNAATTPKGQQNGRPSWGCGK